MLEKIINFFLHAFWVVVAWFVTQFVRLFILILLGDGTLK